MPRRAGKGVRVWFRSLTSSYVLLWTDEAGKQRQEDLGHADRRKAERQRAEKEARLQTESSGPAQKPMRLSELLDDYKDRTRGQIAAGTMDLTERSVKLLIKVIGDVDIRRVCYRNGERILQAVLDNNGRAASANRHLRHLKSFFSLAVKRGHLESNPFSQVKSLREPEPDVRILEDDEVSKLLEASSSALPGESHLYGIILTALTTSLRIGAIQNLTWAEIDFEAGVIRVSEKPDDDVTWFWREKRKAQTVPMIDELANVLTRIQESQPPDNPYVFVSPTRYARIQRRRQEGKWTTLHGRHPLNNLNQRLTRMLKKIGLAHLSFHDLRRTCLTNWAESGLATHETKALAGHSKIETTEQYYLRPRRRMMSLAKAASQRLIGRKIDAVSAPRTEPQEPGISQG